MQKYENLKKENVTLEDALVKSLRKSIRKRAQVSFEDISSSINEFKKQKKPLVVKVDHVKDIIE